MVDIAKIALEADSSGLRRANRDLKDMDKQAGMTERKTTSLGRSLLKMAGAVGAITALRAAFRSVSQSAETMERNMLRTEAILQATGNAAGFAGSELKTMAQDLALATLQSTDGVMRAQQALLTFNNVQGDVFRDGLALSADLAAMMGGDIANAAMRMGRVLQDPARELSALRRNGISFTEAQEEMIKGMVEAGDVAGAQNEIIKVLRGQIGGLAEGEAQGMAGAMDTLNQRLDEFRIALGGGIMESNFLVSAVNMAANAVKSFEEALFGPSDPAERMAKLRGEVEQIEKILERERGSIWGDPRAIEDMERDLGLAQRALTEFQESQQKVEQERIDAQQAARDAEEQRERERINRMLAANAERFREFQESLLSEEDALQASYQRQFEMIETLMLDELTVRQAGFENIFDLREHYLQVLDNQLAQEVAANREAQEEMRQQQQDRIQAMMDQRDMLTAKLTSNMAEETERSRQEMQNQIDNLRSFYDEGLLSLDQYHEYKENAEAAHQDRLAGIIEREQEVRVAAQQNALGAAGDFFGNMAQIAKEGGKDSFEAYKTMASMEAGIAASLAILKALASAPPPLNAMLATSIGALAGIQIAKIQSMEYGQRAMGGQVQNGQSYLVGERGPELLTMGSGGGSITPNHRTGGGDINSTNVFQISTGVTETVQAEVMRMAPMLAEMSKRSVQAAMGGGGQMSRAVRRRA